MPARQGHEPGTGALKAVGRLGQVEPLGEDRMRREIGKLGAKGGVLRAIGADKKSRHGSSPTEKQSISLPSRYAALVPNIARRTNVGSLSSGSHIQA
jgi:hypothetical protein